MEREEMRSIYCRVPQGKTYLSEASLNQVLWDHVPRNNKESKVKSVNVGKPHKNCSLIKDMMWCNFAEHLTNRINSASEKHKWT